MAGSRGGAFGAFRARITAGALLAAALGAAGPALAQQAAPPPPTFTLDLTAAPAQQVTLTVAAPGDVPIRIIRGGGPASGVSLSLDEFRNDQGATMRVAFSVGENGKPVTSVEQLSIPGPVQPIVLHVPGFPASGVFHGTLVLSAPTGTAGAFQTTNWQFNLSSAADGRPATLVLDQTAATLSARRPWCLFWTWCLWGQTPTVTVHPHDKTGTFALNGVVARLDTGLVAPAAGFDPARYIDATFNGVDKVELFSTPSGTARDVPPHQQASVTLAFDGLPAGQYTIPIRFTAANSADDAAQVLTVSLKMSDHWLSAVLVLILAAALSFLATRVVAMLRQRAAILQQLEDLRPAWFAEEPPTLPVVWLRAILRQSEELSRRHWLSGQDQIAARLTAAKATLTILDRVRGLREQIAGGIPDMQVRRRAEWALGRVTGQIGSGPLSDADVTRLTAALDGLAGWTNYAQQEASYWSDLHPSIVGRCAEVQVGVLPEAVRPAANELLATLNAALKTEPDFPGKNAAESAYARLSIMWELRDHHELLEQHDWQKMPIDEVYRVVDDFWWSALKGPQAKGLVVEGPAGGSVEAFDAVIFRVRVEDNPELTASFLFNKKLTWHWTIDLRGEALTTEVSSEPRIAQVLAETWEAVRQCAHCLSRRSRTDGDCETHRHSALAGLPHLEFLRDGRPDGQRRRPCRLGCQRLAVARPDTRLRQPERLPYFVHLGRQLRSGQELPAGAGGIFADRPAAIVTTTVMTTAAAARPMPQRGIAPTRPLPGVAVDSAMATLPPSLETCEDHR